jgi:NADH dehydrogenase
MPAATTIWTGGFRASHLTSLLRVERDESGRLPVDGFLRVRGVRAVYAAGDVARALADTAHVAPMSCQYAIPMGETAGLNAVADLSSAALQPFAPAPYVTCLDLGEAGALFTEGWERDVKLTGYWAATMKRTINRELIYPPVGVLDNLPSVRPAA